jgi:hypothetical protein
MAPSRHRILSSEKAMLLTWTRTEAQWSPSLKVQRKSRRLTEHRSFENVEYLQLCCGTLLVPARVHRALIYTTWFVARSGESACSVGSGLLLVAEDATPNIYAWRNASTSGTLVLGDSRGGCETPCLMSTTSGRWWRRRYGFMNAYNWFWIQGATSLYIGTESKIVCAGSGIAFHSAREVEAITVQKAPKFVQLQ